MVGQFYSRRSNYIGIDDAKSVLMNIISGVPHNNFITPLMFVFDAADMSSIFNNPMVSYVDDFTFFDQN